LLIVLLKFVLPFKTLSTHKVKTLQTRQQKIMVPYKLLIKYNSYSTSLFSGIIFFQDFYISSIKISNLGWKNKEFLFYYHSNLLILNPNSLTKS